MNHKSCDQLIVCENTEFSPLKRHFYPGKFLRFQPVSFVVKILNPKKYFASYRVHLTTSSVL